MPVVQGVCWSKCSFHVFPCQNVKQWTKQSWNMWHVKGEDKHFWVLTSSYVYFLFFRFSLFSSHLMEKFAKMPKRWFRQANGAHWLVEKHNIWPYQVPNFFISRNHLSLSLSSSSPLCLSLCLSSLCVTSNDGHCKELRMLCFHQLFILLFLM